MQKPVFPMIAAIGGIVVNLALSFWFVNVYGDYRLLALSTVISGWLMALMLLIFVKKKVPQMINKSLFLSLGKTLLASVALGGAAYGVRTLMDCEGLIRSVLCILAAFAVGVAVYFAVLKLTRSQELDEILSMRKKKGEIK